MPTRLKVLDIVYVSSRYALLNKKLLSSSNPVEVPDLA